MTSQNLLTPVITCLVLVLLNQFRLVQNYRVQYVDPWSSTEEFANLNFMSSDYRPNRGYRSTNIKSITEGHVYSFQNVDNDLYLTSTFSRNANMPSRVSLTVWSDQAAQLWEASTLKPNKGFSLKPLANEFNSITSQIVKKAHSYHPWEFEKIKKRGSWLLKTFQNGKYACLATFKKMPIGTITRLTKCDPGESKQLWRIADRF